MDTSPPGRVKSSVALLQETETNSQDSGIRIACRADANGVSASVFHFRGYVMTGRVRASRTLALLNSIFLCTAWCGASALAQTASRSAPVKLQPVVVNPAASPRSQQVTAPERRRATARAVRRVASPVQGDVVPAAAGPASAQRALMATPSNVSTIGAREIDHTVIRNQRDLSQNLPNVTGFDSGGNRMTSFTIRGMREFGYQSTPGVYPGVAYYVDDVPAMTTLARASLFMNAASINVYRGPQNGTFGYSRPGGVIDVHSAEPIARPSSYLIGSFGNYRAYETSGGISTPVAPAWFLTVDGTIQGRDGFYDNTFLNQPYGDKQGFAGRAKLTFRPSADLQVDLITQHERFNDQTDPFLPLSQLRSGSRSVAYDDPGHERITQDLQAIRVKAALDTFDLLSVTSYRRSTWDFLNDGDGSATPYDPVNPYSRLSGYTGETVRSFTQEFRFKSNDRNARLQWSGGVFAAKTDMNITTGMRLYPSTDMMNYARANNGDVAVFGEASYALTDTLRIVPGLRHEWAQRDAWNDAMAPMISSGSADYSSVLPSLAFVYEPFGNLTTFAKYSRGFRPGGFNAHKQVSDRLNYSFRSESSDNFEIGFKSLHLSNSLSINGSLFLSEYQDYQVLNQFSATAFGVNNAQRVQTYGGELDVSCRIVPEFRVFGGVGVTRATYEDFRNNYGTFTGRDVAFIPRFTANYGAEYQALWGGFAGVQARTTGRYALDDANTNVQGTATVVNAQVGYRKTNYEISVFGRNIFNERYIVNVYDFTGTGTAAMGSLGDPTTYGVRAKVTF